MKTGNGSVEGRELESFGGFFEGVEVGRRMWGEGVEKQIKMVSGS